MVLAYTGRMNRVLSGLVGLAVVFSMVGCSSEPSIVGKWKPSNGSAQIPVGSEGIFEFKGDKTYSVTAEGNGASFEMSGTYTLGEEGAITMKITDAGFKGDLPAEAAAMKPMMDAMFEEMKGQEQTGKIEFKSADEVVLDFSGSGPVTLTRVK